MIIVIDHNLKQVDFHLYDGTQKSPVLLHKISASTDFAQDKKALIPFIKQIKSHGKLSAIGIRLRFGGDLFDNPTVINDLFFEQFATLTPHFPFYIPITLALLKELTACFTDTPCFAFFETAFFRDLPEEERRYALPQAYADKFPIRRFGYHGIFHAFHGSLLPVSGTILSLVLDSQTTVCAIKENKPCYISVGYSPLEGIMGRTTCGDLDPGVAFYLLREQEQSFYRIDNLLKKECGFKGLTGFDLDIDDLFTHAGDDPAVQNAFEIYLNQILRHIGQALAVSGAPAGIVFGGRYARVLQPFIYKLVKKIAFFGITLQELPWKMETAKVFASTPESKIPVLIHETSLMEVIYGSTQSTLESVLSFKRNDSKESHEAALD